MKKNISLCTKKNMNIQWHQFAHTPIRLERERTKEELCTSAQKELADFQIIQGEVSKESLEWYAEWEKTHESIKQRRTKIRDDEDSTWYENLKQEWKDQMERINSKFSYATREFLRKDDTVYLFLKEKNADAVLDTLNKNIESAQAQIDENC